MKYLLISILLTSIINRECGVKESQNPLGPHKCTHSGQCDGDRTCSRWQWCQGTSNCPPGCGVKESQNPLGPHKCTHSRQCDGNRTCSKWRWCQGTSGC